MIRILVFGDSIAYGSWDSEGGWVDRIKKQAHKITIDSNGEERYQIYNLGIGGGASTNVLARIQNEIEARVHGSWELKIILNYGINDQRLINGTNETSLQDFSDNTQKIINIAKNYTKDIIVIGLTPLGDDVIDFKDMVYSKDSIKEYDDILMKVAIESNVQYIPIRDLFTDSKETDLHAYDKLHINDRGHEIIANVVQPYIIPTPDIIIDENLKLRQLLPSDAEEFFDIIDINREYIIKCYHFHHRRLA